jgi:hypothetical protein
MIIHMTTVMGWILSSTAMKLLVHVSKSTDYSYKTLQTLSYIIKLNTFYMFNEVAIVLGTQ